MIGKMAVLTRDTMAKLSGHTIISADKGYNGQAPRAQSPLTMAMAKLRKHKNLR